MPPRTANSRSVGRVRGACSAAAVGHDTDRVGAWGVTRQGQAAARLLACLVGAAARGAKKGRQHPTCSPPFAPTHCCLQCSTCSLHALYILATASLSRSQTLAGCKLTGINHCAASKVHLKHGAQAQAPSHACAHVRAPHTNTRTSSRPCAVQSTETQIMPVCTNGVRIHA